MVFQASVDLLGIASERTAGGVTSFELMARSGVDAVVKHDASSRNPLADPYPWYVLIELSSQARTGLREVLEGILSEGQQKGLVLDATIADSLETGQSVLAHPRNVRRGAAPHRRLHQA